MAKNLDTWLILFKDTFSNISLKFTELHNNKTPWKLEAAAKN